MIRCRACGGVGAWQQRTDYGTGYEDAACGDCYGSGVQTPAQAAATWWAGSWARTWTRPFWQRWRNQPR